MYRVKLNNHLFFDVMTSMTVFAVRKKNKKLEIFEGIEMWKKALKKLQFLLKKKTSIKILNLLKTVLKKKHSNQEL